MKKNNAILVYLPEDLKREFQIACIMGNVGMSEAIRNMIIKSARYCSLEGTKFTTRFLVEFMEKVLEQIFEGRDVKPRDVISFDKEKHIYSIHLGEEKMEDERLVELIWRALKQNLSTKNN